MNASSRLLIGLGVFLVGIAIWVAFSVKTSSQMKSSHPSSVATSTANIERGPQTTNEQWKQLLTPDQYHILREAGTEVPYSSPLEAEERPGTYVSADCGEPLFRSEQKYHSGTGWPSFWAPINPEAIQLKEDKRLFETRTEVIASKCGGHLGHVFDDGPPPTGKRYCMNGVALRFIPDETTSTKPIIQ